MSTHDSKDVRARYAGRLAHQHHAIREAWQANRSPELAAVMTGLASAREDHHAHTGWLADFDGEATVYHYTNPDERPQL